MNNDIEITLLSAEEIWGEWGVTNNNGKLEVLDRYGKAFAVTDLAILTGGIILLQKGQSIIFSNDPLEQRTGRFWTKSNNNNNVRIFSSECPKISNISAGISTRTCTVRPVLILPPIVFSQITKNRVSGYNGTEEVEFCEYPQYVPSKDMQMILENEYQKGHLKTTGKDYTFDRAKYYDYEQSFQPVKYVEYEYKSKKYIRIKANMYIDGSKLANGESYKNENYVWVEVSPVVWLIDDNTRKLISKRGLLAGIRFNEEKAYDGVFENTEMYKYLHEHMIRDLLQGTNINEHIEVDSISNNEYKTLEEKIIAELPKELQEEYLRELKSLIEELQKENNKSNKK